MLRCSRRCVTELTLRRFSRFYLTFLGQWVGAVTETSIGDHPRYNFKALKTLFRSGLLKIECVSMQCVGFNHVLYDALLNRDYQLQMVTRGPKRKGGPYDKPGPSKKVKSEYSEADLELDEDSGSQVKTEY